MLGTKIDKCPDKHVSPRMLLFYNMPPRNLLSTWISNGPSYKCEFKMVYVFCQIYYRLTGWKRFVVYMTADWSICNPLPRLTFINFISVRKTVRGSMYLICHIVRFSAGADQVSRVTSWRNSCVVSGVLHGHVGGPVERPQVEERHRFNRHNAARSASATDWLALCCWLWRHCHGVLGKKCMVE